MKFSDASMILSGPKPPLAEGDLQDDYEMEPVGSYHVRIETKPKSSFELEAYILFAEFDEEEGIQPVVAYTPADDKYEDLLDKIMSLDAEEPIEIPEGEEIVVSMFADLLAFASEFIESGEVPIEESIYWSDIEDEDDFDRDDEDEDY